MRYADALARLLSSPTRPKVGLERMRALCAALGDPQREFASIHVAGTKGKGSTCAMIAGVARAQGLKVGLTTSPHLSCARERIVVDGAMVAEHDFVALEERVHAAAETLHDAPSFFEQMIAMSFLAFARARVDLAVVEVGLGGRLDATNVIVPRASVITRLGIDHVEHLGPTIEDIAREKAGIMKRGVPVLTVEQEQRAARVLVDAARATGAPLTIVRDRRATALRGRHQQENAGLAIAALRAAGVDVSDAAIESGLHGVRWPGRYETVADDPLIILDGAHNETAAAALAETLLCDERLAQKKTALVVGMTLGRDAAAFARALAPWTPTWVYAVPHRSPRAQDVADVGRGLSSVFGRVEIAQWDHLFGPTAEAWVVTGSLYVVGQARNRFIPGPVDPILPLF